jgi:hypothetical protein
MIGHEINDMKRDSDRIKPKLPRKTLIGVLASHDDRKPNMSLVSLFTHMHGKAESRSRLERFHFLFTGGTHDRVASTYPSYRESRAATDRFPLQTVQGAWKSLPLFWLSGGTAQFIEAK